MLQSWPHAEKSSLKCQKQAHTSTQSLDRLTVSIQDNKIYPLKTWRYKMNTKLFLALAMLLTIVNMVAAQDAKDGPISGFHEARESMMSSTGFNAAAKLTSIFLPLVAWLILA
ncbi:uncharacterized protein LOC124455633 [Xenia sp. Carnegie-2017]|uniref:uncharacterized protein LOC124455633 n=1 Tax=Xenia sp. Carnegie-2017 TaxID=2897299 RepID=UPI001F048705|nr:uncharacterized protein LOC124455633 [Xenia sp. Carnegie-2017]